MGLSSGAIRVSPAVTSLRSLPDPAPAEPIPFVPPPPGLAARAAERTAAAGPVVGKQRWNRLLFAHWTVPAADIQARLPRGLFVDTFAGQAYLGLVPFFMERVRPRGLPPVPGLSWFLEYNARTYVFDAYGRPGVWFFSLDCNQPIAVTLARRFFHLPYKHATMSASLEGQTCDFFSTRRGTTKPVTDRFTWTAPVQGGQAATPGSLEEFLVERYRLFAVDRRDQLVTGSVRHAPYGLHTPVVRRWSSAVGQLAGFALAGPPVSLLAADTVDVDIHPIQTVDHPR
jgi:uncharacterized protein YqjF (DUF2071 family)